MENELEGAYRHFFDWQYLHDADNFGCLLYRLIAKADVGNKEKLRRAFPVHIHIYERWMALPNDPEKDELIAILSVWSNVDKAGGFYE